tara:strand:- start:246 stop:428 length:183 start_codon:yes stop_codon:yes gene_type:complete
MLEGRIQDLEHNVLLLEQKICLMDKSTKDYVKKEIKHLEYYCVGTLTILFGLWAFSPFVC